MRDRRTARTEASVTRQTTGRAEGRLRRRGEQQPGLRRRRQTLSSGSCSIFSMYLCGLRACTRAGRRLGARLGARLGGRAVVCTRNGAESGDQKRAETDRIGVRVAGEASLGDNPSPTSGRQPPLSAFLADVTTSPKFHSARIRTCSHLLAVHMLAISSSSSSSSGGGGTSAGAGADSSSSPFTSASASAGAGLGAASADFPLFVFLPSFAGLADGALPFGAIPLPPNFLRRAEPGQVAW